jgi:hypothetical protein
MAVMTKITKIMLMVTIPSMVRRMKGVRVVKR